jgi:sterol desaturase/sphingolipid hydroxylase (fatty acid hydroxylase superfamily)
MSGGLIAYLLIALLVVCLTWEMVWPRRPERAGLARRWASNVSLALIGQVLARGSHALTLLGVAWLARHTGGGVFAHYDPGWLGAFVITGFLFEIVGYYLHVLMHEVPWLWRIHAVHHSDTDLDVLSTYRHHPGEPIFVSAAAIPIVILLAPPAGVVLALECLRMAVNVVSHANVYIPEPVEGVLRHFVITPDFHRLHHCSERRYTNSNYGVTVPWFDRLFGTASTRPFADQSSMELGLEYFRDPRDSRLDRLLLLPFRSFPQAALPERGRLPEPGGVSFGALAKTDAKGRT